MAFLDFIKGRCTKCETLEEWIIDLKAENQRLQNDLTLARQQMIELVDKSRVDSNEITKSILDGHKVTLPIGPSNTIVQQKHNWSTKKQQLESDARKEAAEATKRYWTEKLKKAEEGGLLEPKTNTTDKEATVESIRIVSE